MDACGSSTRLSMTRSTPGVPAIGRHHGLERAWLTCDAIQDPGHEEQVRVIHAGHVFAGPEGANQGRLCPGRRGVHDGATSVDALAAVNCSGMTATP